MRLSAALLSGFAASTLACHLETHPSHIDRFIRHRSVAPKEGEQLYTLEFADGTTRDVTDDERWALRRAHIRFFDVTNQAEQASYQRAQAVAAYPTTMTQVDAVNSLIGQYSRDNLINTLTHFSSYHNRYYRATTGVESAQWLFDQISTVISGTTATVTKITHDFDQFSIIATIPGRAASKVIVGAHQDSINGADPQGPAPGADDDGSGSMAILEALRVILSDARISAGEAANTLEFHWYAGEEAGLLGSNAIFNQYAADGADVVAMLNQDMIGYSGDGNMGVITDFTDPTLSTFTKAVIDQYCAIGYLEGACGYACSDHASATRAGYPAAFVFEAPPDATSPFIHTPQDAVDTIDFDHAMEHAKLILGFMTELAFAEGL